MIRKGQYGHPAGDGLSPSEQFYLLAVLRTANVTFATPLSLMLQNLPV